MKAPKPLIVAEAALGRGDYTECLSLLKKLIRENDLPSELNGKVQLLMVTAYMGKGDEQKAISMCRALTQSKDTQFRIQEKQIL